MKEKECVDYIVKFLKDYANESGLDGYVVGVSGGIDSAVASTLCARTGKKVMLVNIPTRRYYTKDDSFVFAEDHINFLRVLFPNVDTKTVSLFNTLKSFKNALPNDVCIDDLSMANTKSRLRMVTLYAIGCTNNLLVCGTGNKVEDFGVGFFTKYGDGGVDISPIGDLLKSDVYKLGKYLHVSNSILNAAPTDGLWEDGRVDEDQLGMSYDQIEWIMKYIEEGKPAYGTLDEGVKKSIDVYLTLQKKSEHKMNPIPVCMIPDNIKG